jgi:hypothetical protein
MPWDQGPGLRCPGALVPGFPSKLGGNTRHREKEKKLYNNLWGHYVRNYQMMTDGHVADMGLKYACN